MPKNLPPQEKIKLKFADQSKKIYIYIHKYIKLYNYIIYNIYYNYI